MTSTITSQIDGEFSGFSGDTIFKLQNGQVWQQSQYHYHYAYSYRPAVKIFSNNGRYEIQVAGVSLRIPVVPISVLVDGTIVSEFNGFDGQSVFQFDNGQIWQQSEYKYDYHYAYRPSAMIVDGINGTTLHVDGMSDTVTVRRIR